VNVIGSVNLNFDDRTSLLYGRFKSVPVEVASQHNLWAENGLADPQRGNFLPVRKQRELRADRGICKALKARR